MYRIDEAYCYTPGLSLSVSHKCKLCKKGWTTSSPIWRQTHVHVQYIRYQIPNVKGHFWWLAMQSFAKDFGHYFTVTCDGRNSFSFQYTLHEKSFAENENRPSFFSRMTRMRARIRRRSSNSTVLFSYKHTTINWRSSGIKHCGHHCALAFCGEQNVNSMLNKTHESNNYWQNAS